MARAPKVTIDRTTATAKVESRVKYDIGRQLNMLLQTAYELGYVITVELEPHVPLAMGNYRMVGFVRGAI